MQPDSKNSWSLVLLIIATGIAAALFIGKAPPSLPHIREELGISLFTAGWVASVFHILGAVFGLFAGLLADRLGPEKVIMGSLIVLILGALLGSWANSAELLLFSRVLEGAGYAATFVSAPSLIAINSPPKIRAAAVSLWSSTTPIGMTIALIFSPLLIEVYGWRANWFLTAAIATLFLLIFSSWILPRLTPIPRSNRGSLENIKVVTISPGPWLLAIIFMNYTFQWVTMMVWLPTFGIEERGLSINLTAWITALAIAVNVPGNWFGSWLIHNGVSRWLLIFFGTLIMGSTSVFIFSEQLSDELRFCLVLLFSFCGGVQPAALISGATVHSPTKSHLGATNGFMYQGSQSGSVFGPPIVAAIVTQTGKWEPAGWLLFSLTCISLLAVALMRKYEKRIGDKY